MAIATLAQYLTAPQQILEFNKSLSGATGGRLSSYWSATGIPAAGALAIGNTANGLVPDNTTTGAMTINAFSGTAYLTGAEISYLLSNPLGTRAIVYDRLFHAGSYAFNASTSLVSQPSYSARVPNGDYTGLQLWCEIATTITGVLSTTVTYTDQDGNTGATTGAVSTVFNGPAASSLIQLPLASGDCGIQKIESVTGSVASAGTFNIVVARPIWQGFFDASTTISDIKYGLDRAGLVTIPSTACLALMCFAQSHASVMDVTLEVSSG